MKKHILFLCVITILSLFKNIKVIASENSDIPESAVEFNGHSYKLLYLNMEWEEAEKYCESIGGHLATITSFEENEFIFSYIISLQCESAFFGASDKNNEGIWEWVTNEEFIYSNWSDNEPNNEGGNENYAMFYYKYPNGAWNDGKINTIKNVPYICEWDFASTPNSKKDSNNGKEIHIVFNIDSISPFGGISFIGFVIKKVQKKD